MLIKIRLVSGTLIYGFSITGVCVLHDRRKKIPKKITPCGSTERRRHAFLAHDLGGKPVSMDCWEGGWLVTATEGNGNA